MDKSTNLKRYQINLTVSHVEEYRKVARELRFPLSSLSSALDDYIPKLTSILRKLSERTDRSLTFLDLFTVIGENLDEMRKEDITSEKQKTKKASKAPAAIRKVARS